MRCFVRSAFVLSAATVAVAALSSSAFAQAQTISFSQTVASQPLSFSQTVNLNRFDTSLGELIGIRITVDANAVATLDVENRVNNPSGDQVRTLSGFSLDVPVTVTGPAGLNFTATTTTDSSQIPNTTFPQTFNVGDARTYTGPTVTSSASTDVPTAGFGDYIGTGSQTVQLTLSGNEAQLTDFDGDTGLSYTPRASAGGTVTVTYTYVTPEPTDLAMLAVTGLPIGAFVIRRRRRQAR